ncbi:hypothetical protein C0995_007246, partial [Termitomyces sp. Mi166
WSKSIYSYGLAACLLEDWDTDIDADTDTTKPKTKTKEERKKEAERLMKRVPDVRQKIAGKSIPLEKFVARKSRKFNTQSSRLLLPALEIAYIFSAIAHAPRAVVFTRMLPLVRRALGRLAMFGGGVGEKVTVNKEGKGKDKEGKGEAKNGPEGYEGGAGEYWDDLCLARFLEGDPDAHPDPADDASITLTRADAERDAEEAFKAVFEHGPRIELDHYIVYHAHYEYGRLLACRGDIGGAKREFELVMLTLRLGKPLEVGASGRKNALHIRTHAALDALSDSHKCGA